MQRSHGERIYTLPTLLANDPILLPTPGLLAPAAMLASDFNALTHDKPLNDLTYAVFQLKMKSGTRPGIQLPRMRGLRGRLR